MLEFKLPLLGSDMEQGKLLQWKVKPGDRVRRGDIMAVVDTSKAAIDVEIWMEGVIHELCVPEGEIVPVGTVLATLLDTSETPEAARPLPSPEAKATPATPVPPHPPGHTLGSEGEERRRVSPAARKRAEELDIDLGKVQGSGPQGTVTLEDVERAAAEKEKPVDRHAEMRRTIAAAMARSKREIPHYYLTEPVPLEKATAWLAAANAERPVTRRLLLAVLFIKAAALAVKRYPEMNGFYRDGAFQASDVVHPGIAISLRQGGLIAPALLDAEKKSLELLMQDLADLVKRARAGSLKSSEISLPTLTITNLGDQGVETVQGVIYPPQVALIGFGRVAERSWAEDGRLRAIPAVTASLSGDHRVSDGHRGALFLAEIRKLLQEPEKL